MLEEDDLTLRELRNVSLFKSRAYVAGIKRPFAVRYDPFTSSMEVLDNPLKIQAGLESLKDELKMLTDALSVLA